MQLEYIPILFYTLSNGNKSLFSFYYYFNYYARGFYMLVLPMIADKTYLNPLSVKHVNTWMIYKVTLHINDLNKRVQSSVVCHFMSLKQIPKNKSVIQGKNFRLLIIFWMLYYRKETLYFDCLWHFWQLNYFLITNMQLL